RRAPRRGAAAACRGTGVRHRERPGDGGPQHALLDGPEVHECHVGWEPGSGRARGPHDRPRCEHQLDRCRGHVHLDGQRPLQQRVRHGQLPLHQHVARRRHRHGQQDRRHGVRRRGRRDVRGLAGLLPGHVARPQL
ncbi:MAG: hypothetical protein AVDCRST_MAG16-559, partial [uncultured Frankineae bacterium]